MIKTEKNTKISKMEVIKLSFAYFGILSKRKYMVVGFIAIFTVFKNYLRYEAEQIKLYVNGARSMSEMKTEFVKSALYISMGSGMNFLIDHLFEKYLTPYGGCIAIEVLNSLLSTNSREYSDTSGSMLEYYTSEGGKALAKISRHMLLSIVSKLTHLFFGYRCILKMDDSDHKIVTIVYTGFLILLTVFKLFNMPKILEFNNLNMDLAYEKEKSINETLENISVIKSYGTVEHSLMKYEKKAYAWESANMSHKFWILSTDMLYSCLSTAIRPSMSIFLMLLCPIGTNPKMNRNKHILNHMDSVTELLKTINSLVNIQGDFLQMISLTDNVINYMKLAREETSKKIRIRELKHAIEVQNLTYINKDKIIFSDVSFTLNRGDKAALFGRNGTGKSSIFRLLLGFDTYHGSILVDGLELSRVAMDDYRKLVTYVPQDTRLFDESIFYNLSYGNDKTFREVVDECKKIGIHDTVMGFPEGYNTPVGEGGKNINGGLRQKIFYARAFLCDSEVYLFDEPTNNLDVGHSKFLLQYVNDAKYATKTFMVICHDREIVSEFPKILQFEDGRIHEVASL